MEKVLQKLKEYQHQKELYVKLMSQLVDEAIPPHGWDGTECRSEGSTSSVENHDSSDASGQPNGSSKDSGAEDNTGGGRFCGAASEEPPGFPFYDNMIDLQFNVMPGDRERTQQCGDKKHSSLVE